MAILSPKSLPRHRFVKPMLATLVDKPFDRKGWLFEIKWDGYRAIAEVNNNRPCQLYSRRQNSFRDAYPSIVKALQQLKYRAVFDGEIVAVDQFGKPSFQLLQNHLHRQSRQLRYYLFDLLEYEGRNLRDLPLLKRREQLRSILTETEILLFSTHVETQGKRYFKRAVEMGLEGIMAKAAQSTYREGIRSRDWLKIKTYRTQEAIICGFTRPTGAREYFGSLVLGAYQHERLVYIGHTGTGFDTQSLAALYHRLQSLLISKCPFEKCPKTNQPATWVLPRLVCEVRFQEWTSDSRMRHPVFLGLREDKSPSEIHRELVHPLNSVNLT